MADIGHPDSGLVQRSFNNPSGTVAVLGPAVR